MQVETNYNDEFIDDECDIYAINIYKKQGSHKKSVNN